MTHWGLDKMADILSNDILKCIVLNENILGSIDISLKFVAKRQINNQQINNIPALIQIMAWRRPGDKPLSEPMMECLVTYICMTRTQGVLIKVMGVNKVLMQCVAVEKGVRLAFVYREY